MSLSRRMRLNRSFRVIRAFRGFSPAKKVQSPPNHVEPSCLIPFDI